MELKEFVTSTLTQIVEGILEAQRNVAQTGGIICPGKRDKDGTVAYLEKDLKTERSVSVHKVLFDVAVSVSSKKEGGLDAGIVVLGMNFGGKGKAEKGNESISRLQFEVPVSFPLSDFNGPYADKIKGSE